MSDQIGAVTAAGDDEIAALEALRVRLSRAIDDAETPARDLSSVSRRYLEVLDLLREARTVAAENGKAAGAQVDDSYVYDPESL